MGVLLIFLYGLIEILFNLFEVFLNLVNISYSTKVYELVIILCFIVACVLQIALVIGGFIAVCMASKGLTDPQKQLIMNGIHIMMNVIVIPTVVFYIVFFIVYMFIYSQNHDDRALTAYAFLYGILKSVIYYGFCESLKALIRNSIKVCEFRRFDYLPLTMPEMTYQLSEFPEYSL